MINFEGLYPQIFNDISIFYKDIILNFINICFKMLFKSNMCANFTTKYPNIFEFCLILVQAFL